MFAFLAVGLKKEKEAGKDRSQLCFSEGFRKLLCNTPVYVCYQNPVFTWSPLAAREAGKCGQHGLMKIRRCIIMKKEER